MGVVWYARGARGVWPGGVMHGPGQFGGVNGLLTRIRPRRARCTGCGRTHVLLACVMLARRADCAEVIGAALVAKASGVGHRRIAAAAGVPEATVRGWLRRFTARAWAWRDVFTSLVMALDPEPEPVRVCGSVFADAVSVMGVAAAAAAAGSVPGRRGSSSRWRRRVRCWARYRSATSVVVCAGSGQHELPLPR